MKNLRKIHGDCPPLIRKNGCDKKNKFRVTCCRKDYWVSYSLHYHHHRLFWAQFHFFESLFYFFLPFQLVNRQTCQTIFQKVIWRQRILRAGLWFKKISEIQLNIQFTHYHLSDFVPLNYRQTISWLLLMNFEIERERIGNNMVGVSRAVVGEKTKTKTKKAQME